MSNRIFWRAFKITSGCIFLIAGLVGFLLPILQGILLTLAGISLLASESRWVRKLYDSLRNKIGYLLKRRERENAARGAKDNSPR
ncbi:MAG: PGPGW domain-containing protein [Acidobacteriota bacterium]